MRVLPNARRAKLPPNRRRSQPQSAGMGACRCTSRRCELEPDRLSIRLERKGAMADKQYDRSTQDLGNIVNLGHVNVCINDQHLATHYYISGLGLTRDPFLNTGAGNMWVNVGISQFHLPTGQPDGLRGVNGLVVHDRATLL